MQTNRDSRAPLKVIGIIIAAFACAGLFWLLPARNATDPTAAHMRVAIAALAMATYTGAGIWFITNLHFFTARLRTAYALVSVGLIAFSLALMQLPVLGLFNLWDSFWISSGAVVAGFAISPILIYSGMRQYARLVEAKSSAVSYLRILAITVAFAIATYFISPYLIRYPDVPGLPTYLAVVATTLAFVLASTRLAWRLSRSMGSSYHHAMRWLAIALTAMSLAGLHEYITAYLENDTDVFYVDYGIYLLPFVAAGFFALRAAYAFSQLTHTATDTSVAMSALTDQDYTDSIITLAALPSNPKDIDTLLDNMRMVTSGLSPGTALKDQDKKQLLTTYLELEEYLTSGKDPARIFTVSEVRERLNPAFVALLPPDQTS
jgi:hypothetical protein